ncbi:MAG TPA: galactokinase [Vicinamibacterales bacterium]|nr:galactokinase [Acidobacteriota bacterium]HOC17596.1 galactokinase [Vicinamibacterales bacterium]
MTIDPSRFEALFGRPPELEASAPGRVNLIGEHTDYNEGFVLPTVIPQRTHVALGARSDRTVRAFSAQVDGQAPFEYRLGSEQPRRDWTDYVQGITWVLGEEHFAFEGADLFIESSVPVGSGLSSSAALLVAVLRAFREEYSLPLDDVALARLAKRAENDFVGAPVGIMDQMVCSLASDRQALFLDARTLEYRLLALPPEIELVVINSGVAHQHSAGDYRTRRAECERAAAALGVPALRDLTPADLPRAMALPEPLGRRARHVVTEDERVLQAVAAIERGDLAELGRLFYASHASMRDDYEVSVRETDLLVELARAESAVHGARLTGGGFGGSVVILAEPGKSGGTAARVKAEYDRQSGRVATVLVP